ncbi:hypothetical protein ZIOFF_064915 [Zingiber officinale]|uniref:BRISC and BRCA1-A complex member 2 n=1 Tax=Zingiber officinale TaxID=94328 RepID=A0A8J5EXY1_ZINOF|nr:hypothetical protein ZIOFF_064915 [Zingiber officinale]
MVGSGSRRDDAPLKINSTNVFTVLETLKKKKKSDKESKSKGASQSQGKEQEKQVFWAPAPLTSMSWADVERVWPGSKNTRYSNRLTLSIPFRLDYIKWDVIYNVLHSSLVPDVVFSLEDDDFDPLGDIAREGDLYTHYERRRVGEIDDARLKFELNTMLSREGIEVCMVPSPDRVMHFLCVSTVIRETQAFVYGNGKTSLLLSESSVSEDLPWLWFQFGVFPLL